MREHAVDASFVRGLDLFALREYAHDVLLVLVVAVQELLEVLQSLLSEHLFVRAHLGRHGGQHDPLVLVLLVQRDYQHPVLQTLAATLGLATVVPSWVLFDVQFLHISHQLRCHLEILGLRQQVVTLHTQLLAKVLQNVHKTLVLCVELLPLKTTLLKHLVSLTQYCQRQLYQTLETFYHKKVDDSRYVFDAKIISEER